jgi:hypothetical protein
MAINCKETATTQHKTFVQFDSYDKENGYGGGTTSYFNVSGNCKMSFIDAVASLLIGTNEQKKAKMDHVLSKCHIIVSLNTNDANLANWIKENYELYAFNKVPVGYNAYQRGQYQYHFIIRNTHSRASNKQYLREIEKSAEPVIADRKGALATITNFLKKRRRKTDVAEEIVAMMYGEDNTEGQVKQ